jgi:C_GCAxxG_C_C family probable redox protein
MERPDDLRRRLEELENRSWDIRQIEGRLRDMARMGRGERSFDPLSLKRIEREALLDEVQRRAEEYEYLSRNCAKGAALALMELFGVGSIEMVKGMSAFPGIGMTGWICGAVTGVLFFFGQYFGDDDVTNYEATGKVMGAAREFISRFHKTVGTIICPEIHERIVFGRYMDPRASEENLRAFREAKGYEKCALLPGIAARIAVEVILADQP